MISKLAKALESASIERQVEDAYNEALKKAFPDTRIEYPFACDGYCEFNAGDRNDLDFYKKFSSNNEIDWSFAELK